MRAKLYQNSMKEMNIFALTIIKDIGVKVLKKPNV